MSQEKETKPLNTVKTKKRLIAAIIRWFFATLFAVLLILAIVFQAAWKIILLLSILLAGLTLLPKSYRKWFYACLGVTVLALIIWVFLPDDNQGWRPYTFDEEVAILNAKYAIPDKENAGLIYEKLVETFDGYPDFNIPDDDYTFGELSRKKWTAEEYPEYAEWLNKQDAALDMLMQATQLENCHFPIVANPFSYTGSGEPIYPAARRWARFLNFAGNFYLAEGRRSEALVAYIATMRLGNHFQQQPCAIYKLVGMSIEALGLSKLDDFAITTAPSEDELLQIENAIDRLKVDWDAEIAEMWEYDKLYLKNILGIFYETGPGGKTRLSHNPTAAMRVEFPDEFEFGYWKERLFKIGYLVGWFFLPSTPQEAGKIIDIVFEKAAAKDVKESADSKKIPFGSFKLNFRYTVELMANISLGGAYSQIPDLYLKEMTEIKGSRLLIALRRFKNKTGAWPEKLEQVKPFVSPELFEDPAIIESFVYGVIDDTFRLYSKGKNGIDEGGEYETVRDPNTYESTIIHDDRLIWPPKLRSNQEEGTDPNDEE